MALIFMDGFETYNTAGISLRWSAPVSWSISATTGRRGGGCLTTPAFGSNSTVQKALPGPGTVIIGFAIKFPPSNPAGSFLRFFDGLAMNIELVITALNRIDIYSNGTLRASGSIVLTTNVYHFVEFKFTIASAVAADSCLVKVDGVADAVVPAGASTKNGSNDSVDRLEFFALAFGTAMSIDDLYVLDGTGSTLNDFIGDKKVEAVFPDADGSVSDWTASAGSDYQCVNDPGSDGDTSYVASETVDQEDTFTFPDLGAGAPDIDAVQVNVVARKDDAGSRAIAPILVINSSTYTGDTLNVADGYLSYRQVWETNPDTSAAWTDAEVNALEAGIKLVS